MNENENLAIRVRSRSDSAAQPRKRFYSTLISYLRVIIRRIRYSANSPFMLQNGRLLSRAGSFNSKKKRGRKKRKKERRKKKRKNRPYGAAQPREIIENRVSRMRARVPAQISYFSDNHAPLRVSVPFDALCIQWGKRLCARNTVLTIRCVEILPINV